MARFIYADNHAEYVPSAGLRIMEAIANIDKKLPDDQRVVAVVMTECDGKQCDLLVSIFEALVQPEDNINKF